MFVIDSHCDTPSQIMRLRNMSLDNPYSQVDFPKLLRGKVNGAFWALYTPASMQGDTATRYALELLAGVQDTLSDCNGIAALATSPDEAADIIRQGRFAVMIGMENGSPIGNSLALLRQFHRMGVRYLTLCHSADNAICDSCAQGNTWHGLSDFGKSVIAQMNRLGMIIDVSHISDESFYDVIKYSKAPVIATHSCCRALASHKRNMTDDMIKSLAENGGVIQINFYPVFLDDDFAKRFDESGLADKEYIEDEFIKDPGNPLKIEAWHSLLDELAALARPSYKRIVDHIDHVVGLVGIEHVGLGSDFDGICVTPEGLDDVSAFPVIFEELKNRGYKKDEIASIAGMNFLNTWKNIIGISEKI